jgi:hypothetical protein
MIGDGILASSSISGFIEWGECHIQDFKDLSFKFWMSMNTSDEECEYCYSYGCVPKKFFPNDINSGEQNEFILQVTPSLGPGLTMYSLFHPQHECSCKVSETGYCLME